MQSHEQPFLNGAPLSEVAFAMPPKLPDLPDSAFIVPDWPAPANVRALCTTRLGGVSSLPFDTMNLGTHVGDRPDDVQTNRHRLAARLSDGAAPERVRPVFMDQVHGTHIAALDFISPDGLRADGAVTGNAYLACTVMVADCLPVLLCNADGTRVAAAHAGWRGLAGQGGRGVLEEALAALTVGKAFKGHQAAGCFVWLGPCIGPSAFEVGDEVRAAFVGANAAAQSCFEPLASGKWLANLPGLARQRLGSLGVVQIFGNDGSPPWCTVGNPSRFFSYRRDGVTGRMAACIWRVR